MGTVEICNGTAGATNVLIRLLKRAGDPPKSNEHPGVEAVKKMGATWRPRPSVPSSAWRSRRARRWRPMASPPACTVSKHPMYAVIEVEDPKQATPIDKVRPIAEKMSSRF
jgi:hypothetical protein